MDLALNEHNGQANASGMVGFLFVQRAPHLSAFTFLFVYIIVGMGNVGAFEFAYHATGESTSIPTVDNDLILILIFIFFGGFVLIVVLGLFVVIILIVVSRRLIVFAVLGFFVVFAFVGLFVFVAIFTFHEVIKVFPGSLLRQASIWGGYVSGGQGEDNGRQNNAGYGSVISDHFYLRG